MEYKRRTSVQQEQLYVVEVENGRFWVGDSNFITVPWSQLGSCHVYAADAVALERMLADAAIHGHQISQGSISDRRGLGGFTVLLGHHGISGEVHCRRIDSWAFLLDDLPSSPKERATLLQSRLRDLCDRMNLDPVGFRPTALAFLRAIYEHYGRVWEPEEVFPPSLPAPVARLCRRAHVGGPILHVQTTLEPYVRLDRKRAYGEAMSEDLPAGSPIKIEGGMSKWNPRNLMRALGVVDATVRVFDGPLVPLLPVLRHHAIFDRARAIYPTGFVRGAFVLEELAHLEQRGLGEVQAIHEGYVFEPSTALRQVVSRLRTLEPIFAGAVPVKRLEHMLYGSQSRSLSFRRFASAPSYREPVLQDILDSDTLDRVRNRVSLQRMPVRTDPMVPLFEVRGTFAAEAPHGVLDRPDRSAHITARNRIAVSNLILHLDEKLGCKRSGERIGRVYVDGVDLRATPSELPDLPKGWEIRESGARLDLYRTNTWVSRDDAGEEHIEVGGASLSPISTREELLRVLMTTADPEGGPLASGRFWPSSSLSEDPRLLERQVSEPIDFVEGAFEGLGFDSAPE